MNRDRQRGQITAETAMLIVFGVAALVAMGTYVQRAMQGGAFSTVQSYGSQFDPRDAHSDRQSLNLTDTVDQQVGSSMAEARLLETADLVDATGVRPFTHPEWVLESLPSGAVPREPAYYRTTKATTNWTANGQADFQNAR